MDMTNSAQCSLYFLILMKLDEAYFFKKKKFKKKGVALVHLSFTLDSDQQVT